jgi:molybdopterin converting factor subunit 1
VNVHVKLFAVARQIAGHDEIEVRLSDGATVGDLRHEIAKQVPSLAPLLPHLMIALDAEYADEDRPIRPEDEIACIPPVSGG